MRGCQVDKGSYKNLKEILIRGMNRDVNSDIDTEIVEIVCRAWALVDASTDTYPNVGSGCVAVAAHSLPARASARVRLPGAVGGGAGPKFSEPEP